MPTRSLTDLFVERVKPPGSGRLQFFDASFAGLAFRVTSSGHKSWSLIYRGANGKVQRFTLGAYPAIKPAQARREAAAALDRLRAGVDPAAEKKVRRHTPSPAADTFGDLVRDYIED